MNGIIIDACQYKTKSCNNFLKINDLVIQMVENHYFDLQMYANFVYDIDNDPAELSDKNNFYTKIESVKKEYNPKYPTMNLFTQNKMENLEKLISRMLVSLKDNWLTSQQYLSDIDNLDFFGSGAASATILLKANRVFIGNNNQKYLTPLIIKIIPFEFPHHYPYLPSMSPKKLNEFVWTYIESPSYALFIKEAWMYCFSQIQLTKYTPTFTCISNCYFVKGLPVKNLQQLTNIYTPYAQKRINAGKNLAYKKWFNILTNVNENTNIKEKIMNADYGCFEMKQIEKTLDDIMDEPGSFDLSLIFEYLYTKVVSAFIGRIIFTDDHFGNVAYTTVDYVRSYNIKCNGCDYKFYMPAGKMVQFIDLERYVFNFSRYDIYTNTALRSIPDYDYTKNKHLLNIKDEYIKNNYIFDKSLSALLSESINENSFQDPNEYKIMLQIITSPFIHDIKTFCQIMEANLPQKYLVPPTKGNIVEYFLDLDDDSLRIINTNGIYEH
ncbi:putative orfan [Tupanvirus soda lake]|uniref:Orfan n=2 Tax=Tupanvirus TaxID=2094720 RepID=A0AC62ACV5_9VIRU|nr:putative orfan [Tupanvirus soda lake]QKU35508.1 putative orfan [Tupanvirus soda lake]